MDAEHLLAILGRLQLMASAATLLVLLLRPLALRWYGASAAYGLWLVVPLAAMAVLLPERRQVVSLPALGVERVVATEFMQGPAAVPATGRSVIPYERLGAGLLIALWLSGAGASFMRSVINTRKLASCPSTGPALIGVLRPRLVLPRDFEVRFNAAERALILAHEEMHRISRHTMVNALVEVARSASWFNPLAHIASVRFRADQELACDASVIAAHPESRRIYAEALLKAQVSDIHLPMGCVWTSDTAARLAERIARLSEQVPGRRRTRVGAASVVGIGIATGYASWAEQPARIVHVPRTNSIRVANGQPDTRETAPQDAMKTQVSSPPPTSINAVEVRDAARKSESREVKPMRLPAAQVGHLPALDPVPGPILDASLSVLVRQAVANTSSDVLDSKSDKIMAENDLNGDGVITKAEAVEANRPLIYMWELYDTDHDNIVTAAEVASFTNTVELGTAVQKLGGDAHQVGLSRKPKPEMVIAANDLNGDGVVTKEEATRAGGALIRMWHLYDLNKDDKVDAAEIAKASGY